GKTVTYGQRHTDVIELLPASMAVADMIADNPGNWQYHCHVADHMESGMMATYTIVAPQARSCPLKFGAGEFWQTQSPSNLQLTNTSNKSIKRLSIHAGYFVNTPENLNPVLFEWLWTDPTAAGATRTVNLTDEKFRGGALANFYVDNTVVGLIFFP